MISGEEIKCGDRVCIDPVDHKIYRATGYSTNIVAYAIEDLPKNSAIGINLKSGHCYGLHKERRK